MDAISRTRRAVQFAKQTKEAIERAFQSSRSDVALQAFDDVEREWSTVVGLLFELENDGDIRGLGYDDENEVAVYAEAAAFRCLMAAGKLLDG